LRAKSDKNNIPISAGKVKRKKKKESESRSQESGEEQGARGRRFMGSCQRESNIAGRLTLDLIGITAHLALHSGNLR
jgi:hypothetical protein